ncbi:MAG TPA: MBOAT family O-acyltransferase [Gemmataceae bacterium]|jgi:alginate O-acetyltransferase complex protein AlgI|nr:MBOAT family O-acyltransferase [Gemmataceae bacterium]
MLFCSQTYLFFFAIVFILYWSLPWSRARIGLLLLASFTFYASWNRWLACLVFVCTSADYFVGRGLDACRSQRLRRLLLCTSLAMNLGLLCWFKYVNFFLGSLEESLRLVGVSASFPLLSVLLPVGISFYTFEAISYIVDIYRRRMPAERRLDHFLLFITFFPHLVAGPIVRARDFLPQVRRPKRFQWTRAQIGVQLFLLGMFKKLVIADRLALVVDPVFAQPGSFSGLAVWIAVVAYAVQIYCDFSGYTDMALGSAHLLGYKLALNFNLPYTATNVAEFWHRWHISLSTWLRDYLFIPLGGSRGTAWHTARNLLITMTLGGLWHGAKWTFVLWGLVHGLLLIGHRVFREACVRWPAVDGALRSSVGTGLRVGATFLTVTLCWVLFRATSLAAALAIYGRLFHLGAGSPLPMALVAVLPLPIGLLLAGYAARRIDLSRLFRRLPAPALGWAYGLWLTSTLLLVPGSEKLFVYFQF